MLVNPHEHTTYGGHITEDHRAGALHPCRLGELLIVGEWVERADDVGGWAGGCVAVAGPGSEVDQVGVAGLGGSLSQWTGEVVHGGVCVGCGGVVLGDEVVGEGAGRSSGEGVGDGGVVEGGVGQCCPVGG